MTNDDPVVEQGYRETLIITVFVNDDDTPVEALKRADVALADVGLNIAAFETNQRYV